MLKGQRSYSALPLQAAARILTTFSHVFIFTHLRRVNRVLSQSRVFCLEFIETRCTETSLSKKYINTLLVFQLNFNAGHKGVKKSRSLRQKTPEILEYTLGILIMGAFNAPVKTLESKKTTKKKNFIDPILR